MKRGRDLQPGEIVWSCCVEVDPDEELKLDTSMGLKGLVINLWDKYGNTRMVVWEWTGHDRIDHNVGNDEEYYTTELEAVKAERDSMLRWADAHKEAADKLTEWIASKEGGDSC